MDDQEAGCQEKNYDVVGDLSPDNIYIDFEAGDRLGASSSPSHGEEAAAPEPDEEKTKKRRKKVMMRSEKREQHRASDRIELRGQPAASRSKAEGQEEEEGGEGSEPEGLYENWSRT